MKHLILSVIHQLESILENVEIRSYFNGLIYCNNTSSTYNIFSKNPNQMKV